jgi:hypothetical protein
LNDELVVDAFGSFLVANTYTIAQSDAKFVELAGDTMTGSLSVSNSVSGSGEIVLNKTNSGTANQNGQAIEFLNYGPAATARNAGTEIGKIYFGASQPSSGAIQDAGAIACIAETQSGNNTASALVLSTNTGNAGNVERMRIDSGGRVTKPSQPSFFVSLTNAQTVSSGGQRINFNTKRHDVGSNYNTSTYRFTAPVAGRYLFTAWVSFDNVSSGSEIQIYKNSVAVAGRYDSSTGFTGSSISVVFDMAANDYIEIFTYLGASRTYTGRADDWTGFCGQLLS